MEKGKMILEIMKKQRDGDLKIHMLQIATERSIEFVERVYKSYKKDKDNYKKYVFELVFGGENDK